MRTVILHRRQVFQGPLLVINRDHPLHSAPADLAALDSLHPHILLERRTARLLAACIQSVGGQGEIVPVSGWRSRQEQQAIWDDTLAESGADFTRKYVALPGCSEHQSGLAIDLGKAAGHIDFIRPAFPYDGVCGAFRRAAAKYGFIERYQRGKESVTGIAREPWHFRYVGAPHALLMEQKGFCLEEYVAALAEAPMTCTLENGRRAVVRRLAVGSPLPPANGPRQISADNTGGVIVTDWEAAR